VTVSTHNIDLMRQVAAHSDHQMSNGVAQLLAGVGKVFVGEIIAKGMLFFA
jgi:hypothetical protein